MSGADAEAVEDEAGEVRDEPISHDRIADVDPACGPFRFPSQATESPDLKFALKQSFGFGGSNSAMVLGRGADR